MSAIEGNATDPHSIGAEDRAFLTLGTRDTLDSVVKALLAGTLDALEYLCARPRVLDVVSHCLADHPARESESLRAYFNLVLGPGTELADILICTRGGAPDGAVTDALTRWAERLERRWTLRHNPVAKEGLLRRARAAGVEVRSMKRSVLLQAVAVVLLAHYEVQPAERIIEQIVQTLG